MIARAARRVLRGRRRATSGAASRWPAPAAARAPPGSARGASGRRRSDSDWQRARSRSAVAWTWRCTQSFCGPSQGSRCPPMPQLDAAGVARCTVGRSRSSSAGRGGPDLRRLGDPAEHVLEPQRPLEPPAAEQLGVERAQEDGRPVHRPGEPGQLALARGDVVVGMPARPLPRPLRLVGSAAPRPLPLRKYLKPVCTRWPAGGR